MSGLSIALMLAAMAAPTKPAAPAVPTPTVSVKMAEYKGWPDAVHLSNGTVDLVLVPDLGRVMRFGYVGGPNVLWENPKLLGQKRPDDFKEWFDAGGDKVWPAEQTQWKSVMKRRWPPDRVLDGAPQRVEVLPGKVVKLVSGVSPDYGIKLTRVFRLSADRASVVIDQRFDKVEGPPVKCCIWTVTQTDDPDVALLPVRLDGPFPDFYHPISTIVRDNVALYEDVLQIRRRAVGPTKYGSDSAAGWVASVKQGTVFSQHFERITGDYPDSGCSAEVFTQEDAIAKMVELETLSPQRVLKVGQSLGWSVEWRLERLSKALGGVDLTHAVRSRMAPPAWLNQGRSSNPTSRQILY